MDQTVLLLSLGAFSTVLAGAYGAYRIFGDGEARQLRRRLGALTGDIREQAPVDVVTDSKLSSIPIVDTLLRPLPLARSIQLLLTQGDSKMRVGSFLLMTATLALLGGLIGSALLGSPLAVPLLAVLLSLAPYLWAVRQKKKRLEKFERMFPDALDMMTGALRAGLAFSGAIQVVADECADPISREFMVLFEETRLGMDTRQALRNLAVRVDSKELHLFVIAVLLQRETGGNLTEILEQTAAVIRERLRILGDVRALTAQARLSGAILAILPMALAAFILATAPDYLTTLIREPLGRHLLITAATLQLVGFFIMRRIASIKV